jgi:hypothetical protein
VLQALRSPLPTLRTQPVEVQPVAENLTTCQLRHLLRKIFHEAHLWVNDLAAAKADEMRMRIGPAAIVTIIIVAEAQFQHFAQILQKIESLVDGRRARGGELSLDLFVKVGCAGMSLAGGDEPQQRRALRRQAIIARLQLGHQLLEPGLRIRHG